MANPKLSAPLAFWGNCETETGNYDTAIRIIRQGIEIENTSNLQALLARAALLNGDTETARTAARKGLELNDSTANKFNPRLKYYLIYSELSAGNMDEALQTADSTNSEQPANDACSVYFLIFFFIEHLLPDYKSSLQKVPTISLPHHFYKVISYAKSCRKWVTKVFTTSLLFRFQLQGNFH
ncbi:MAG: hypothetical protein WA151_07130 [Desulfatirhabdiaceae bacterium]